MGRGKSRRLEPLTFYAVSWLLFFIVGFANGLIKDLDYIFGGVTLALCEFLSGIIIALFEASELLFHEGES